MTDKLSQAILLLRQATDIQLEAHKLLVEAFDGLAATNAAILSFSGKDGSQDLRTAEHAPGPAGYSAQTPSPVPANPPARGSIPPPTGGGFFSPDDGTPLRYGDVLDNGRGDFQYFAGPCYVCGKVALTKYKPGPGKEGQHRCWPCFKAAKR